MAAVVASQRFGESYFGIADVWIDGLWSVIRNRKPADRGGSSKVTKGLSIDARTDQAGQIGATDCLDVLVIGAGQAGISTSFFLNRAGIDHLVLEKDIPFSAWHNRWDGFYANTPNWMNILPRRNRQAYPGATRTGFATKDELVDYFENYLDEVGSVVLTSQHVEELRQLENGKWSARTASGKAFEASNVVVCTGAMSAPKIPELSRAINPKIAQMHSKDFRRPSQVASKSVLVVGSGSSGVQICKELLDSQMFDQVHLATSNVMVLPNHVIGVQIHRLLHMLGLLDVKVHSPLGRIMYKNLELKGDPIRRPSPKDLAKTHELIVHDRLTRADDDHLRFGADDVIRNTDLTIIWCTGFKGDYHWVKTVDTRLKFDIRGYPVHCRGIIDDHPGLYFVGLRYQHTVTSHDIYGVGNDAEFVVDAISARVRQQKASVS